MPNLREDRRVAPTTLTAAWDGITPAAAPAGTVVGVSMPGMGTVGIQITGTFTATVVFEVNLNQGSTPDWRAVPATNVTTKVSATTATAAGIYQCSVAGATQFRVRCSAFTSSPTITLNASAAGGGSGTAGSGVDGSQMVQGLQAAGASYANNNPVMLGFLGTGTTVRLMTAGPSLNNTSGVDAPGIIPLVKDTFAGNYFPSLGDATGRRLVYSRFSFNNITTNATTVVKSGAGTLHSITINTKGAAANTITVYDNTAASGTKIATIDSTLSQQTLLFNAAFATGLTVVTATGTAPDITVSYL